MKIAVHISSPDRRIYEADEAREKDARSRSARNTGPALLEALKGLMIDCPFGPATPEAADMNWNAEMRTKHAHWVAARQAISAAEDWANPAGVDVGVEVVDF